jgi:acid phosphatase type 7
MPPSPKTGNRAATGIASAMRLRLASFVFVSTASLLAQAEPSKITKGPWAQRVTETTAVVRVEVDPPGPVTLDLSAAGSADSDGGTRRTITSSEARSLHAMSLGELEPGTRYTYQTKGVGPSKSGSFTTAPHPTADAAFHFLVFGDNRTDDAAHAAVVRAMVPVPGDFLIHTGDFVENGGSLAQWQTFFDIEAPLIGSRCLFSAVGNHELSDKSGIEYARFFGPTDLPGLADVRKGKSAPAASRPEHLDGTFRWGNARFFLLNGMVTYKNSIDRTWLEKALTDSDAERELVWRIVVTHHGPWSSGPHGGNARFADAGVPALLKAHKVDLVISGHDHIYERGWGVVGGGTDGIAYLVSGGGGAPTYPIKHRAPQSR